MSVAPNGPQGIGIRTGECGRTLIETIIASTIAIFVVSVLAGYAGGFARDVGDLREATETLVEVQTARNRFMWEAAQAVNYMCSATDVFQVVTDGVIPPISTIEYKQTGGDLHRVNTTTGADLTIAKNLASINCAAAGGGELDVVMTFGGAVDEQTRLLFRVSDGMVVP